MMLAPGVFTDSMGKKRKASDWPTSTPARRSRWFMCVIDQPTLRRVTGATQRGGNSLNRPPDWPDTENPVSSKCISHLWLSEKLAWYRGTSRSQLLITPHCDLESLFAILCC